MKNRWRWIGIVAIALAANAASAAEPDDCLMCHAAKDLQELSVAELLQTLSDPGLPAHGRFSGLTEEQVTELIEKLKRAE